MALILLKEDRVGNYYANKKSKKGTGQHAISNSELKSMLEKEGLISGWIYAPKSGWTENPHPEKSLLIRVKIEDGTHTEGICDPDAPWISNWSNGNVLAYRILEPCYECGSTERIGTTCKPCNPEITDPNFGLENG